MVKPPHRRRGKRAILRWRCVALCHAPGSDCPAFPAASAETIFPGWPRSILRCEPAPLTSVAERPVPVHLWLSAPLFRAHHGLCLLWRLPGPWLSG